MSQPVLIRPVAQQYRVTSGYGPRKLGGVEQFHPGIDFATPIGTQVVAPADGVVVYFGLRDPNGYGLQLVLRHNDTLYTQYAHLSRVLVSVGDVVRQGQPVALSGNTGRGTGAHLHFEVRTGPSARHHVNPAPYWERVS